MNIINIEHISKVFGEKQIFEDASFGIQQGDKIGIVGINGTGKSTVLRMIAGEEEPDQGQIIRQNGLKIAYLPQSPHFPKGATVASYVLSGNGDKDWLVQSNMTKLGIEVSEQEVENLSGGQRRKLALAKVLAGDFDVLLLDEPTNHLDEGMINWLEEYLKGYKGVLVMVTHDRYFLDKVSNRILEISRGNMYGYDSNYSRFLELKAEREEMELASERKRQSILRMELEWAKRGCRARSTKQRARLDRLEALKQGKAPISDAVVEMDSVETRMGKKTIELYNVTKRYGDQLLLKDFTYTVLRNQRLGIVGPNGCGKSTLLKTLMGQIPPLGGSYTVGTGVEVGYFDQQAAVAESMYPDKTVLNDFWDMYPTLKEVEVRNALGSFLFTGEEVFKTLGQLSGGEKVRLALCKMFKMRPNLLILDEPTNHMDLIGKEALENMLKNYTGTILFVSHDRYFIKEIATGMLDFKQDKTVFYDCGYEEYLERLQKEELKQQQLNQEKEEAERNEKKSDKAPTLKDVFDKKTYYNPGKILSRLKQQMAKYEKQLEESEQRLADLQMQIMDPALASDYTKLMELEEQKQKEEQNQESLLERMLETETELEEMQQQ